MEAIKQRTPSCNGRNLCKKKVREIWSARQIKMHETEVAIKFILCFVNANLTTDWRNTRKRIVNDAGLKILNKMSSIIHLKSNSRVCEECVHPRKRHDS
jgi:hypothetical protein